MRMQFELLELMTLCFAWVVYHQPILAKFFCLSGVFGGIGAELRGHVYKQRYIKDIRLFGEKAKAFNFLVSNLLILTQHPRSSVHVSSF